MNTEKEFFIRYFYVKIFVYCGLYSVSIDTDLLFGNSDCNTSRTYYLISQLSHYKYSIELIRHFHLPSRRLTDYCANGTLLAKQSISSNRVCISSPGKWWGGLNPSRNQKLSKQDKSLKLTANTTFVSVCYFCPFLFNLFVRLACHIGQLSKHGGQVFNFLLGFLPVTNMSLYLARFTSDEKRRICRK